MASKRKRDHDAPWPGEQSQAVRRKEDTHLAPDPKTPKEARPIEEVHRELEELFQEGDFWNPFHYEGGVASRGSSRHTAPSRMAMATVEIMDLLKEYPVLARHRFHDKNSTEHGPLYPLELFVYNWFGKRLLDRVKSLFPPAASKLMDYVTRLRQVHSEETLLWILNNCGHNRGQPTSLQVLLANLRSTGFQEKLSTEVIQAFAETNPNCVIPVSDLFQDGYCEETVAYAVGAHTQREDSIELKGNWELTQMHARVLTRVLPKLKEITLSQSHYALDGWIAIVASLQACQNLKKVTLEFAPSRLSSEPNGVRVLKSYLQDRPTSTCLRLDLDGMCNGSENNSILNERNRQFFAQLLEGTMERQTKGPVSLGFKLQEFHNLPATHIHQLAGMCKVLALIDVSIAGTSTNSMDVGMGKGIDRFTPSLWRSLCGVSKLTLFSNFPKRRLSLTLDWDYLGLRDLTDLVAHLLECQFLQEIIIWQGRVPTTARYCLDFDSICERLADNHTLNALTLKSIEFQHSNQQSIPTMLVQLLKGQNTTLSSLELSDSKLYTVPATDIKELQEEPLGPCRYADFESARKVQYLTQLNSCRRARLRSKTATTTDVLNALSRARAHADGWKEKLVPIVDGMAPDLNASDLEQVNASFTGLMGTVNQWSEAPLHQHAIDTQSILYGLLRESPGLWIH